MTWWVKSHSVNGMARTLSGQVRDGHSFKCSLFNAGCWIHLHEQLTTFYISLADVIPIVGGRSYKLRVYYAGHVNFIRLIRLVPRSSDIALRPSYVAIVRRQDVVRSWIRFVASATSFFLLVVARFLASRHLCSLTGRYNFMQSDSGCILCCWLLTETVSSVFLLLSFP